MLNMGLGFLFTAKDLASGAIRDLERNFMSLDRKVGLGTDRIQGAFQELGVGLAAFTVGAATLGGAFTLAEAAGRFEQSIAAVGAVSGATREELEALRGAALEAGIATQFSPTEATLGLRELAQAGFSAQESMQLLIPVLDLAGGSLGELSPQAAAGLAAQALKAFGLSTDQASISVDRMLQAVNVFALNAAELPLALGTASRGAQALSQSLSETLIALGLVKNVVPGVERASTAVATSMSRMADPKVQSALKGLGVQVVDAGGRFRSFLDILSELTPELQKMTEAERSAFLIKTFGAEALGGLTAILTQLTTGVKSSAGELLKGGDAVKHLRDQFEGAAGTAASFREQMLNTFEGQKKLLRGSLETLAIVAGEPFAQVFKPLVGAVVGAVNALLGVFRQLPAPVKRAFAALVVGAGAVATLVGGILLAKATIALFLIGLQAAEVTLGAVLAPLAAAGAIFGVLAVAVAGFAVAFQNNVGGLGDFFRGVAAQVSLGVQGLMQLFDQGGFSGAVKDELSRAENQGLKDFLINVFLWVNRLENFFAGIGQGFSAGIEAAGPSIESFLSALRGLGEALGLLSERDDAGAASERFAAFGTTGEKVGRALAAAFELVVGALTVVTDVARGAAGSWAVLRPAVMLVANALGTLGGKLTEALGGLVGISTVARDSGSTWTTAGQLIAAAIAVILGALGALVSAVSIAVGIASAAVRLLMSVFSGLADVITGVVFFLGGVLTGDWGQVWMGLKLIAFGVVDAILGAVLELGGAIAGVVDSLSGLLGSGTHWEAGIQGFRDSLRAGMAEGLGVEGLSFTRAPVVTPTDSRLRGAIDSRADSRELRASSADGAESGGMSVMPAVAALTPAPLAPFVFPQAPPPPPPGPVVIHLEVDGERLATAVHRADRDSAGRSFSPIPSY